MRFDHQPMTGLPAARPALARPGWRVHSPAVDRDRVAAARIDAARVAMASRGLDALLLASGTNLCFLTGYPVVEPTLARPFYLLLPRTGAPVLIVHTGREFEARSLSWIRDVRTYDRLSVAPVAELRAAVRSAALDGGRIGAELGFEQRLGIPVLELQRIEEAVAPAAIVDASPLLWDLRLRKAPWDVAAMRQACACTAGAYDRMFASVRLGSTEREVALTMMMETGRAGGGSPWVAITSGPGRYDVLMGSGADRALEHGDMVWLDSGCTVDSLWSDFGRAGVVGGPTAEQTHAQRMIIDITAAGVGLVRPGRPVAEIAATLNERVRTIGLPVTSDISALAGRVGHGVGLDMTEPPHVSEDDDTILEPGMTITIEPGVATAFGLFHAEQNVLVTDDGHEVLTLSPSHLRTISEAAA
jgi:Xaa-Pro dipeptidase